MSGIRLRELHRLDVVQAEFLEARRIDQRGVARPCRPSTSVVLVVVCLPELSACEISPICAVASGTSRLISVLLPAPEGPSTSVVLPVEQRRQQ